MSALDDDFRQSNGLKRTRILAAVTSPTSGVLLGNHAYAAGLSPAAIAELKAMTPEQRESWARSADVAPGGDRGDVNAARPAESLRGVPGAGMIADEYAGQSRREARGGAPHLPPMVRTVQVLRDERLLPTNPSAAWRGRTADPPSPGESMQEPLAPRFGESDVPPPESEQAARLGRVLDSPEAGREWTWDALASGLSKAAVAELRGMAPEARRAWLQAKRGTTLPGQLRNVERLAGGAADALYGPSRGMANAENVAASPPEPERLRNRVEDERRRKGEGA